MKRIFLMLFLAILVSFTGAVSVEIESMQFFQDGEEVEKSITKEQDLLVVVNVRSFEDVSDWSQFSVDLNLKKGSYKSTNNADWVLDIPLRKAHLDIQIPQDIIEDLEESVPYTVSAVLEKTEVPPVYLDSFEKHFVVEKPSLSVPEMPWFFAVFAVGIALLVFKAKSSR